MQNNSGAKPDDFRVVYTNSWSDFLSGSALIKQGEDVIMSLLGDGLHDELAEAGALIQNLMGSGKITLIFV